MAGLSDYLENKLLDFLLRGQAFTPPATVYVGLLVASPSDAAVAEIGTTTANGYARVAVASGLSAWKSTQNDSAVSTGSSGATTNTAAITFPAPSGGSWFNGAGPSASPITHFALFDAATGGNLLFYGALLATEFVALGDGAPSFAAGSLALRLDN